MRRTRIFFSRLRVCVMSQEACIRMRVSIFTPNAFSIRKAMSPDRSALPFNKLDNAGRDTRSAAAAAVTDRPAGWIISARMKSPGWCGFFMGMMFLQSRPPKRLSRSGSGGFAQAAQLRLQHDQQHQHEHHASAEHWENHHRLNAPRFGEVAQE